MGCNAHNHPRDCNCGWGGMWHGNTPLGGTEHIRFEPVYVGARPFAATDRLRGFFSLTIPNAKCPVCGVSVFFYMNRHGSRVFFDDLGPPWPKHPCTDNPTYRQRSDRRIWAPNTQPRHRADWLDTGWRPFTVRSQQGASLVVESVENGKLIAIRLDRELKPIALEVLYLGQGRDGWLRLSALDAETGFPVEYHAKRRKFDGNKVFTGFLLYCQREREVCRAIDARRELEEIIRNRFSNSRKRKL